MVAKYALVILAILSLAGNVNSQPTQGHLNVKIVPAEQLPGLIQEVEGANYGPKTIESLIKIGGIYLRRSSFDRSFADSAVFFGNKAIVLARQTRDWFMFCEATLLVCKSYLTKDDVRSAKQILAQVHGEQSIRLLLAISEYYVGKMSSAADAKKAFPYIEKAKSLSDTLSGVHWKVETNYVRAKTHFRLGEITKGKNCYYQIIDTFRKLGDKEKMAHWYSSLGHHTPDMDSTYALQINSFRASRAIYQELKKLADQAEAMRDEAFIHTLHGRNDLAEQLYVGSYKVLKSSPKEKLWTSSIALSTFYSNQGDYTKSLYYAIDTRKELIRSKDTLNMYRVYEMLGDIHRAMDEPHNSIKYYNEYLLLAPFNNINIMNISRLLLNEHIKINRAEQGLNSFKKYIAKHPSLLLNQKHYVAAILGDGYAALGQFSKAEKRYLEMLDINEQLIGSYRFSTTFTSNLVGAETYLILAKFYAIRKYYSEVHRYASRVLTAPNLTPGYEREARLLLFKADSASGKYLSSIHHYQRYSFLKDSIEDVAKNKEFSVLKLQFQTAQKENDIEKLEQQALLRDKQLVLAQRTRNFTFIGIAGLAALLALIYNRYRINQQKNRQLEDQKRIINEKNESLLGLVSEKEWLLKEVHHRVKNNLQTVISLLNSQSSYLKDEAAMNAITNSRLRIQAVSILHQRLYQTADMVSITMPAYINELVQYLDSSLNTNKRVLFNLEIDNIELEISQAVPIGLIMNEAITNALKYAFPDGTKGEVRVIFSEILKEKILLSISDNGVGLPAGFDSTTGSSFGLKLIRGLVGDLAGDFDLSSDEGTTLMIEFRLRQTVNISKLRV